MLSLRHGEEGEPRPTSGAATHAKRWKTILFWVVVLGVYVGLRALYLEADPPRTMLHGNMTAELLAEPAAKAHEARIWARTGAWSTNPVDNYQFWRVQSPFWVYPLALAFKLFGVSYATLRLTATVFGIPGLIGVILLAHRRWGRTGALLAGVFYATDNIHVAFGRSGILEPIVAGILVLGLVALDKAFDHVGWLLAVIGLTVVAMGVKLAALPALPVFAVFGGIALQRARGVERPWRWRLAIVAVAVAAVGGMVAYALTDEYQRRLMWNFTHMVGGRDGGSSYSLENVGEIGPGLAQLPRRFVILWCALSAVGVMAFLEIGLRVKDLVKRRASARDLLPSGMFLAFFAAVFGATYFAFRFAILLAPPAILLAVDFLHRVTAWAKAGGRERVARRLLPIAGAVYAAAHVSAVAYMFSKRNYQVERAATALQKHIDGRPDAVCIGLYAGPVVLETTCTHYYVKKTFNATYPALAALRPTHLLLMMEANDDTRAVLQRTWPTLITAAKPVDWLPLRHGVVTVLEVSPPPEPRAAPGG